PERLTTTAPVARRPAPTVRNATAGPRRRPGLVPNRNPLGGVAGRSEPRDHSGGAHGETRLLGCTGKTRWGYRLATAADPHIGWGAPGRGGRRRLERRRRAPGRGCHRSHRAYNEPV